MRIADLPADRPIPDTDDLRLLAELITNVSIPLANAAWNARMSRAEAALRLVSMAERGLPLRLVADGDRQALWHIAQAGPATRGLPVTGGSATAGTGTVAPSPPPLPGAVTGPSVAAVPVGLPPMPAVPPHEQAIAGAVPLGEPPFGSPEPSFGSPEPSSGPTEPAAASTEPATPLPPFGSPEPLTSVPATPLPVSWSTTPGRPAPTGPRWQSRPVSGPGGEQLVVTILDVLDPGDRVLTDAGFRMDPGQRAVLVHSSVANTAQVPFPAAGDEYLVLETDQQILLGKDGVAVATHPGYPIGVAPGHTADGWSVFLIPSETVLRGLKWCIRPDIPQTIVGWPIAP